MKWKTLDDADFVEEVNEAIENARTLVDKWREKAIEDFDFYAGRQWSEDDVALLNEQERPVITFNKAKVIIDSVSGNEMVNRQEPRFLPRGVEDSPVSETMTGVVRWIRDLTQGEFEDSDAFRDTCISGMGWTEYMMDYETNPDGEVRYTRVDPLEFVWDTASKKPNLLDMRWMAREKWLPDDDVQRMWPGASKTDSMFSDPGNPVDRERARFYENPAHQEYMEDHTRVVEVQWYELEPFWRYQTPEGFLFTGDKDMIAQIKKSGAKTIEQHRRVYCRAIIIGDEVHEREENVVNDFTYRCITGFRDRGREGNTWFGLMRGMRDPQNWYNKFYSQILHIINSNSKGGFFWETNAIRFPDKLTDDLARPDRSVELNPGGLQKIQERQMFQFPSSLDRMMQISNAGLLETTGVNIELLGLTNKEQPGVLESQRTQQALTIISTLFDSLRRYRKEQGILLLKFIREFIADNRMIRIVGERGANYVRLSKDIASQTYDIIVDQAANSPNAKTEAWIVMGQILGPLAELGYPPPPTILDYLPLPSSIVEDWKKNSQQQIPPQVKEMMMKMQEELQKLSEENQRLKSKETQDLRRTEVKAQQGEAKSAIEARKVLGELQTRLMEVRGNLALKAQDQVARQTIERVKARRATPQDKK